MTRPGRQQGENAMKPEAQRIAIAEACGWVFSAAAQVWYPPGLHPAQNVFGHAMPNWPADLNACHEMEHWLEFECKQWFGEEGSLGSAPEAYMNHLQEIVKNDDWCFCGATAAQRCEAFLRTVGKRDANKETKTI